MIRPNPLLRPTAWWLVVLTGTVPPLIAGESTGAWTAAIRLDFKTARSELEHMPADPADRGQRLQRALLLIVTPPQTETRFDEAAAALRALAHDPVADEVSAIAAYQYARLAHTRGGDDDEALIDNYRQVWTHFPHTAQVERAFVFAAIIRQYRANESAADKRVVLRQLDDEAARLLHTDTGRRLYHLSASMAWARLLEDDERARAHLEVVYAMGLASEYTFSDVLFRLGEYHRLRGDAAGAVRYFSEFAERYPVDRRTDLARRLIRQLSTDEDS